MKSTFKTMLQGELLGVYVNPDQLEKDVHQWGFLDLDHYQVQASENEILEFYGKNHDD